MPYHDLNLVYTPSTPPSSLAQTLAFAAELGYTTVALSLPVANKIPSPPPTIPTLNLNTPNGMTLLTRLTLTISDTSQNHRLSSLQPAYHLLALRPTTDKALQLCCSTLACDIISIDFSQRLPFILKFKTVSSALQRGIRFEICYSPGTTSGSDARRNVISGATALIRATRGRGIVLSSEAKNALGLRGPHDVMNLACVWGLSQERGKEGVCEEADKIVRLARLRRESYRGVVSVVESGGVQIEAEDAEKMQARAAEVQTRGKEMPIEAHMKAKEKANTIESMTEGTNGIKRKASTTSLNTTTPATPDAQAEKPPSKRELKRRAKKARLEANTNEEDQKITGNGNASFPVKHETISAVSNNALRTKKKS